MFNFERQFIFGIPAVYFLYAALLFGIVAWVLLNDGSGNIEMASDGETFTITSEDGSSSFTYKKSAPMTISGRLFHHAPHKGIKEGGVWAEIHYLSEVEFQEVEAKYESIGKCPASYYNKKMKVLWLLPEQVEHASILAKVDFKKWDAFHIEGVILSFERGKVNDREVRLPTSRRAQYFLPFMFTLDDGSLFKRVWDFAFANMFIN